MAICIAVICFVAVVVGTGVAVAYLDIRGEQKLVGLVVAAQAQRIEALEAKVDDLHERLAAGGVLERRATPPPPPSTRMG